MKNLLNKLLIAVIAGASSLLASAVEPSMFVDSLELSVGNITDQATYTGLPVLVKVVEDADLFPGFMVARTGGLDGNGSDIRFSQNGEIIPHEFVSTQSDDNGKTLGFTFWVRVPEVKAGSTIKMHWGVKDGRRAPINHPSDVWQDYYGVWHKADLSDKIVTDVSGNRLDATRDEAGNLIIKDLNIPGEFTMRGQYIGDGIDETAYPGGESNIEKNLIFGNFLRAQYGWGADVYFVNQYCGRVTANGKNGYAAKANMNPNTVTAWHKVAFVGNEDFSYAFYVDNVNIGHSGDSQVFSHPTTSVPIRLARAGYSAKEIRLAKSAQSLARIKEEDLASERDGYVRVAPNATTQVATGENYWVREPSMSPLAWSDPSKVVLDVGEAKFGTPDGYVVESAAGDEIFPGGFAEIADPEKKNAFGAYRVVITTDGVDNRKQLQKIIYFAYVSEVKSQVLSDNHMMLFNDIDNGDIKIEGQGVNYAASGWSAPCWSETNTTEVVEIISTEHLNHVGGWRIRYGEIGSALKRDDASKPLDEDVNYLPFGGEAVGAKSYTSANEPALDLSDAGAAILFNHSDKTDPAAVYSPCFENGVGEIYFDAVNMDCGYRNRLELQYLTLSAVTNATGNASSTLNDVNSETWANYRSIANNLEILPIKEGEKAGVWTNRAYAPLMMTKNGEGANTNSFYRVRAKLNISEPVIFRIARTDTSWGSGGLRGRGKILVDNVLVSDPTTVVTLHRLEETWDPERDFGKYLHGDRGTLSKRFPKVGDEDVKARVRVTYEGFGSDNLSTRTNNVAALIFKYRRRYLNSNLGKSGEWKSLRMEAKSDDRENGSIFETPDALDLGQKGEPGFDIEYAFEYTPNPTSYDYVDYFGLTNCAHDSTASSEAQTLPFNGNKLYARTPTLGNDFFIRLREGSSEYEQMEVIWHFGEENAVDNTIVTNNLHLIEDNLWTGAITVTNATSRFSFKLRGVNKNEAGDSGFWSMDGEGDAQDSPYSTVASKRETEPGEFEGFKGIAASLVENTRQFIFRFNDDTGAISVCRGDYQDFNHWTDAASNTNGLFVAHSGQVGDDGQNVNTNAIASSVLQRRYPDNPAKNVFDDWDVNKSTNEDYWTERFTSAYNDDEKAATGTKLYSEQKTPNSGWMGYNFMFVNESLSRIFSNDYRSRAALLVGKGEGYLQSLSSPDGIGEINFDARLGQQHTFDRVSTYKPERTFVDMDYLVSTRLVMSSKANSATDLGFDGQGTASIFTYYGSDGAYEFRMKRLSRTELELGIYRWYQERPGEPYTAKELHRAVRNSTGYESDTGAGRVPGTTLCTSPIADSEGENTTAYVAFFSVRALEDEDGNFLGNQLFAGFTNNNGATGGYNNHPSVATDIAGHAMTWHSFYVQDKGFDKSNGGRVEPIERGTFGFLSTDCPARFMRPQVHDALGKEFNRGKNLAYADKITLPPVRANNDYVTGAKGDNAAKNAFIKRWYIAPSSDVGTWNVLNEDYYGIVTPDTPQKIVVLTSSDREKWDEFRTAEVSSFNYSHISIPAHTTEPINVRISTYKSDDSTPRMDLILDNLEMTQWHATSTANGYITERQNDQFVFTGVWTELTNDVKKAEFWPLRVATNEFQTIRSPLLASGVGAISFSYDMETLDKNAELAIEYVLDKEDVRLYEYSAYSFTNDPDYERYWTVYKTYGYDELYAAGGHITEYLGLRGKAALVRLRTPQRVIIDARDHDTEGNYGRIDFKSIAVWDEPNVDERSWTAWNVRVANCETAANEYGAYDKLLNIDSWLDIVGTAGMSMELNNGPTSDLAELDPALYGAHLPYIQSPALTRPSDNQRSGITVGEINFRARKSGTVENQDAVVEVLAVKSNGETVSIATTNLTSTAWQNITIKNKESGVVSIRLVMKDYDDDPYNRGFYDRAIFDELSVVERVDPNVVITFARPFRNPNALDMTPNDPVDTIESPDEQPLCGEEWGIQCEVALKQLEDVILPDSINVVCDYYIENFYDESFGDKWGYDAWKDVNDPDVRGTIPLIRVSAADSSRLIYRMARSDAGGYMPVIEKPNTVVQYNFRITFKTNQDEEEKEATPFDPGDKKQWTTPEWYYPVDFNKSLGADAAYAIIDQVSPKRAWINEVNVWDGTLAEYRESFETTSNAWIEVAIPSKIDMAEWRLEVVSAYNNSAESLKNYRLMKFGDNCPASKDSDEPFAFYVVAHAKSPVAHDAVMQIPNVGNDDVIDDGRLSEWTPYALRLVRPTGIVDHEILLCGCEHDDVLAKAYDEKFAPADGTETGHNKVVVAGYDSSAAYDKNGDSVTLSMVNVNDYKDLTVSSAWENLTATPGSINILGQIDEEYRIDPNNNTYGVYCSVIGEGIEQDVGNNVRTSLTQHTSVEKNSGEAVTIRYYLGPWYDIGVITVNGEDVADLDKKLVKKGSEADGVIVYEFSYVPTDRTTIKAYSCTSKKLAALIGENNPYEDAIIKWMRTEYPTLDPETLQDNLTKLVDAGGNVSGHLTLTEMYWIDADPTKPDWYLEFWNGAPTPKTISVPADFDEEGNATSYVDENIVTMPMHILYTDGTSTNRKRITCIASTTYGINSANWKDKFTDWTSNGPSFQVLGSLQIKTTLGEWIGDKYVPIKCYIFNDASFDSDGDATIRIPDPFGPLSITGKYLNWGAYKNSDKEFGDQIFWRVRLGEAPENLSGYSLDYLR